MNDQQIYALMAKTPGIRAVQIADALDAELTDVSAALRPLVEVGDVVQTKGWSPNGHPAQVYELSDAFKKSREGKELLARLGAPAEAKPAPAAEIAETVKLPVAAIAPEPTLPVAVVAPAFSKVDRAIAFITKFGAATDSEIRDAMGLTAKDSPTSYLASARKSGRVIRDGALWKLGTGKPQSQPKQLVHDLGNVVRVGNVIVATRDHSQVDPALVAQLAGTETPPPAPTASKIRCAIWSDGTYEVKTDGVTVALLSHNEAEALLVFVEKIGAAA